MDRRLPALWRQAVVGRYRCRMSLLNAIQSIFDTSGGRDGASSCESCGKFVGTEGGKWDGMTLVCESDDCGAYALAFRGV